MAPRTILRDGRRVKVSKNGKPLGRPPGAKDSLEARKAAAKAGRPRGRPPVDAPKPVKRGPGRPRKVVAEASTHAPRRPGRPAKARLAPKAKAAARKRGPRAKTRPVYTKTVEFTTRDILAMAEQVDREAVGTTPEVEAALREVSGLLRTAFGRLLSLENQAEAEAEADEVSPIQTTAAEIVDAMVAMGTAMDAINNGASTMIELVATDDVPAPMSEPA